MTQPPKPTFEDEMLTAAKIFREELSNNTYFEYNNGFEGFDRGFSAGARWGREYGKREALACAEVRALKFCVEELVRHSMGLLTYKAKDALAAFEKLSEGGSGE